MKLRKYCHKKTASRMGGVQGEDKVFTLNDLATTRAKSVAAADD